MMRAIKRRAFLQVGVWALAALALAVPAVAGRGSSVSGAGERLRVRVRSRRGEKCAKGDERFCERARFMNAGDAMRAAAARGFAGEIVSVGERA